MNLFGTKTLGKGGAMILRRKGLQRNIYLHICNKDGMRSTKHDLCFSKLILY